MKLVYRLVLIASSNRSPSVSAVRGVFLYPALPDERGLTPQISLLVQSSLMAGVN